MNDSTANRGDFFAIGRSQWRAVCKIGLNAAIAFLVLARGTGRDNATTSWSAEAISRYSGTSWRRGKDAIAALLTSKSITQSGSRQRPRYKLAKPKDREDLIWLPNALVTSASDETPPVARLRQARETEVLELFIELYGEQDLAGDGGLPRSLLYMPYSRERIMDMGQFIVYGFNEDNQRYCRFNGPLKKYSGREHGSGSAWERLGVLNDLGLLEWITYLAEDGEPDGELIHALTGDDYAQGVQDALYAFLENLPEPFVFPAERYNFVVPVIRHMSKATLVDVCRLRYRPRTSLTSAWYAQHVRACREYTTLYRDIAGGELRKIA